MTADDMFRKYVFDHTNNQSLTDMVCKLNTSTKDKTVCPGNPELNDDEIFASKLYELIPCMDLVSDFCHIRDLLYGDGSRTLDVDPTYRDAEVRTEPLPKNETIAWFKAVQPQCNFADDMAAIRERMHDLKFNPMKAINEDRYNNLSELDKLAITPVDPNPYYNRF